MASTSDADADIVVIGSNDIADYNEEQILPLPSEGLARIRAWLKPTPYDAENGEYRKHLASHLKGTGDWLVLSSSFSQWCNDEDENTPGLLWIKGIPGSGKSVTAASLIQRLASEDEEGRERKGKGSAPVPVLYFFFRQIIDANHAPVALLRDWLCQLLPYSPPLQVRLEKLVKNSPGIESLSVDALWDELEQTVAAFPRVYFVVDALDEMDRGNDVFLQKLAALGNKERKVFVTSRPVANIEAVLRLAPKLQIRLDQQLVDQDIATYVESRLATSSIPQDQHDMIKQAVPGRASGLFLYAKLAMDTFVQEGADVDEAMKKLPADLNAIYEDLLREHARRSGVADSLQLLILSWVTHAARPLRLLELATAVQTDQEQNNMDIGSAKELVRAACGPLIEILPDETVSVIHHSLTEFLKGSTRPDTTTTTTVAQTSSYPVLDMGSTHSLLARSCLSYMLQTGILGPARNDHNDDDDDDYGPRNPNYYNQRSPPEKLMLRYPFARYSFDHVCHHIGMAEENSGDVLDKDMVAKVEAMLTDEGIAALDELSRQRRGGSKQTPIHVLARWGLGTCLGLFLDKIETAELKTEMVNAFDGSGKTPLHLAASLGHDRAVKTLLSHGAEPDKPSDYDGLRPLHEAARNGRGRVVDLLLRAGVDPLTEKGKEDPKNWYGDASSTTGHTALMYAMKGGHRHAAAAFLRHIGDSARDKETISRALAWAAEGGYENVVRAVLAHPAAQANTKVRGDTPLFLALKDHKIGAAMALLGAGADPSLTSEWGKGEFDGIDGNPVRRKRYGSSPPILSRVGFNALHALCGAAASHRDLTTLAKRVQAEELTRCMAKILETKAGLGVINVPDEYGETPLRLASPWAPPLVDMLLSAGVDLDVNGEWGDQGTCLHAAKQPDMVRLLVRKGNADLEARRTSDGMTPLLLAVKGVSQSLITTLLELGADPAATDARGRGALHIFLEGISKFHMKAQDSDTIIQTLLAAGVSPHAKDQEGKTPLHRFLNVKMHEQSLRTLVAAGADINAQDNGGYTLLMNLVVGGGAGAGPRPDAPRVAGARMPDRVLEILTELGARLDVRDRDGRNVLFHYMGRKEVEFEVDVMEALVRHGADPQARDHAGNGLWHRLFMYGASPLSKKHFKALKTLGVEAEARNHLGQSPLHLLAARQPVEQSPPENRQLQRDDLARGLRIFSVDTKDNRGIRPLHMAARDSEHSVALLLEAGASPTEPTDQGVTPLHVAARFRQPNIVGMLLQSLRDRYKDDDIASQVESRLNNSSGLIPSALHLACRSGVPETVALLLAAGADPNLPDSQGQPPLLYCTLYEEEEALWPSSDESVPVSSPSLWDASGVSFDDTWRPPTKKRRHASRLEEILDMLHASGARMTGQLKSSLDVSALPDPYSELDKAIHHSLGKDYTLTCLLNLWHRITAAASGVEAAHVTEDSLEDYVKSLSYSSNEEKAATYQLTLEGVLRRRATLKTFIEGQPWKLTGPDHLPLKGWTIEDLLQHHEWDVIRHWFKMDPAACFFSVHDGQTPLTSLIGLGLAILVKDVLTPERIRELDERRIKTAMSKVKAGTSPHDGITEPLLHVACARPHGSNMRMLQLLLERLGVDVNQQHVVRTYRSAVEESSEKDGAAIHVLASGTSWWQAAEGLPYLIASGADLELRDRWGRTPLLCALNQGGPAGRRAARVLIEAGADVDAVQATGQSCLDMAIAANDSSMVELLMTGGHVQVTASALFSAIESRNPEVLDMICRRTGPNVRRPSQPKKTEQQSRWQGQRDQSVHHDDMWPLCFAAQTLPHECMQSQGKHPISWEKILQRYRLCIEVLLRHGADPYATYTGRRTGIIRREEVDVRDGPLELEVTLLHDLVEGGSLVAPIFQMLLHLPRGGGGGEQPEIQPGEPFQLDIEHKDAEGRTLLLAACCRPGGPDVSIEAPPIHGKWRQTMLMNPAAWNKRLFTGEPSLVDILLDRGADATVQDTCGRNCLHHILEMTLIGGHRSMRRLLSAAPGLVHQLTSKGESPLHYALHRRWGTHGPDIEAIEMLMEAGSDIHLPDKDGNSALHILALSLAEGLRSGGDGVKREFQDGAGGGEGRHNIPIMDLFRRLVSAGLPVNGRNAKGETPVFRFVKSQSTGKMHRFYYDGDDKSQEAVLEMFASIGADLLTTDNRGDTLLHVIAATIEDLRQPGDVAAGGGKDAGDVMIERFQWLLSRGVDPMRVNQRNQTCLDVAALHGNQAILDMFGQV